MNRRTEFVSLVIVSAATVLFSVAVWAVCPQIAGTYLSQDGKKFRLSLSPDCSTMMWKPVSPPNGLGVLQFNIDGAERTTQDTNGQTLIIEGKKTRHSVTIERSLNGPDGALVERTKTNYAIRYGRTEQLVVKTYAQTNPDTWTLQHKDVYTKVH